MFNGFRFVRYLLVAALLLQTAAVQAAFSTVNCTNAAHLATLGIPQVECQALEALWTSTDGFQQWNDNTGWDTLTAADAWFGITVTGGQVTAIDLHTNHMVGPLPPELGNLSSLQILILYTNPLSGSIPAELGNLSNLDILYLNRTGLSGSIPPQLGNLGNLTFLYLGDTHLGGALPPELGQLANLRSLSLSNAQFSGNLPAELGNLANLTFLQLEENQFSGSIPPELGNLGNLTSLTMHNNQLSGSIPPELGSLGNLVWLGLSGNQLSGSIPPELGNLTNLERLYLQGNQLTGNVPAQLANLSSLEVINVWNNQLEGPFPDLSGLGSLTHMVIAANHFVFADFEPQHTAYATLRTWNYSPQAEVDVDRNASAPGGGALTLTPQLAANPSGNDRYQWYKDGVAIAAPAGTQGVYTKAGVTTADAGLYTYEVTNTVTTALTLASHVAGEGIHVTVGAATSYSVGGSVSGLMGNLVLQNNGADDLNLSANGVFTFASALANGSAYNVTVASSPAGQTCSVTDGGGVINGANITNVQVSCIVAPATTYTIGGSVTGLMGELILVISQRGSMLDDLYLNANGPFTFPASLADGSLYTVTIAAQPAGQSCVVDNGSGTVSGGNVNNIRIVCRAVGNEPMAVPLLSFYNVLALSLLLGLLGLLGLGGRRF